MARNFFILFTFILFAGCSAQKQSSTRSAFQEPKTFNLKTCPKNYRCDLEVLPNTSLLLKKDAFGLSYASMVKSDSILIKYYMTRVQEKELEDAHLSEALYFTISGFEKELYLTDEELSKVHLVLHRACYCKGAAGYFNIEHGFLKLVIQKNTLTLNINFKVQNIPHILHQIDEKIDFAP